MNDWATAITVGNSSLVDLGEVADGDGFIGVIGGAGAASTVADIRAAVLPWSAAIMNIGDLAEPRNSMGWRWIRRRPWFSECAGSCRLSRHASGELGRNWIWQLGWRYSLSALLELYGRSLRRELVRRRKWSWRSSRIRGSRSASRLIHGHASRNWSCVGADAFNNLNVAADIMSGGPYDGSNPNFNTSAVSVAAIRLLYSVPEPSSIVLFGFSGLGFLLLARRRRREHIRQGFRAAGSNTHSF